VEGDATQPRPGTFPFRDKNFHPKPPADLGPHRPAQGCRSRSSPACHTPTRRHSPSRKMLWTVKAVSEIATTIAGRCPFYWEGQSPTLDARHSFAFVPPKPRTDSPLSPIHPRQQQTGSRIDLQPLGACYTFGIIAAKQD
jgi:hypothetical protein